MKRLALALLLLTTSAFAQSDPTSRAWNQPVEPFRIIGNIYYVGTVEMCVYLIATPKGHILIDGGFVETAPIVQANIKKLGFDVKDVKLLLASHAHYDHVGGLAELKRVSGAKFYASAGDAPAFARGGLDDPQFGNRFWFPPIEPDHLLQDGERVTLGGTTLTAHVTAGHTRGCTTWTTRVGGHDVVFIGSPTVPPGYKLVGNPRYPNAVDDYRRQFDFLRSIHPDVFLASHGNFFNLKEKIAARATAKSNPFLDAEGYRRFVARLEKSFVAESARQTAELR